MAMKPVDQLMEAIKGTSFADQYTDEQLEELRTLYADADQETIDGLLPAITTSENMYQEKIAKISDEEAEKLAKEYSVVMKQFKKDHMVRLKAAEKAERAENEKLLEELTNKLENL